MPRRCLFVLLTATLAGSPALSNLPDLELCHASIQPAAQGSVIFTLPDGQGHPFTQARLPNGALVDATITVVLVNFLGQPIANYPAEDIWLETSGGSLAFAAGNPPHPDSATDVNGMTRWTLPLAAGGCTVGETVRVLLAGDLIPPTLDLAFVSADLNGDLIINLADLSEFSAAYAGAYSPCADLLHDGVLNLSDLSLFTGGYAGS